MHAWAGDFNNELLPQLANAVAVELALRREDVAGAWELSKNANFDPFPPLYFFHIPQLTQVKLWMRGDATLVKKAEDRLEQLIEFGRSNFNDNLLILALALQSVLYHQTGKTGLARQSLREALALGEAGGHIRTFADLGLPMETLIRELYREQSHNLYLQSLLDAFEKDRKVKATCRQPRPAAPWRPDFPVGSRTGDPAAGGERIPQRRNCSATVPVAQYDQRTSVPSVPETCRA